MTDWLPKHLYDVKDSLRMGGSSPIRACSYLMATRVDFLTELREGEVGLRRATHAVALTEVVYRTHEDNTGTGLYKESAKKAVEHMLETAHLQPQERHFRDIGWWQSLDRIEARQELRSNLERLVADHPTMCLVVGIELHVLFDMMMRARYADNYTSVITDELFAKSDELLGAMIVFARLLKRQAIVA